MARNMSFAMTTPQFINRTKFVTRRWGWQFLTLEEPGTEIMGVKKAMGLKKGEKIERLGMISVVNARLEPLETMSLDLDYGARELELEGYPFGITSPQKFVELLAKSGGKSPGDLITRIEYRYL